jgi:HSP20 family molecular chaperone IbpA
MRIVRPTLADNVHTIRGEMKDDKESKNYRLCAHRCGEFGRSITLPVAVESDKVEGRL